jgi:plasmid stabilization system protein ParE
VNWTVTLRPQAKADLRCAYDWYEERCAGLGDEFLAAQAETLLRLEADPERFPPYYRDFRRVLTHRFPYKIFFRIIGRDIIIFRILHGAQDHPRELRLGAG